MIGDKFPIKFEPLAGPHRDAARRKIPIVISEFVSTALRLRRDTGLNHRAVVVITMLGFHPL